MTSPHRDRSPDNRGGRWRRVVPIVVVTLVLVAAAVLVVWVITSSGVHPTPRQCQGTILDGPC